jgi:hypothetical protein
MGILLEKAQQGAIEHLLPAEQDTIAEKATL